MIRRFIRFLVRTALAEPQVPVLVTTGLHGATVEWRFWPAGDPGAGWYKVTQEPYDPNRWSVIAGLIGAGEHAPIMGVAAVYRRCGERYYVVELSSTQPLGHEYFPPDLREALVATGWQALPADAKSTHARLAASFGPDTGEFS